MAYPDGFGHGEEHNNKAAGLWSRRLFFAKRSLSRHRIGGGTQQKNIADAFEPFALSRLTTRKVLHG
jgi:hypothetical protein